MCTEFKCLHNWLSVLKYLSCSLRIDSLYWTFNYVPSELILCIENSILCLQNWFCAFKIQFCAFRIDSLHSKFNIFSKKSILCHSVSILCTELAFCVILCVFYRASNLWIFQKLTINKMALEKKLVGCRARFFLCKFLTKFGYNKVAFLSF